jgi:hypothetical protein
MSLNKLSDGQIELTVTPKENVVQLYMAANKVAINCGDGKSDIKYVHEYEDNNLRTILIDTEDLIAFGNGKSITGAIKKLRFGNCTTLKTVNIADELIDLDVSKNPALEYFDCIKNQLTALNVSKNTKLTKLICSENKLLKNSYLQHVNGQKKRLAVVKRYN